MAAVLAANFAIARLWLARGGVEATVDEAPQYARAG
jgi:hypothetical protein